MRYCWDLIVSLFACLLFSWISKTILNRFSGLCHLRSVWYFFPVDFRHSYAQHLGGIRSFSDDISNLPAIEDSQIKHAFKDLMATSWDNIPSAVVHDTKKALSKSTEDKAAQDALKNVFRAAEAVEEFTGIVMSLKMELDDAIGLSGEVI